VDSVADAEIEIRANGARRFADAARQLRAVDPKLKNSLTRRIRAAGKPIVQDVRAAVLAAPAKGPRHTGLRAAIAKAVTIATSTSKGNPGIRFRVPGNRMPSGQRSLPPYFEGYRGNWRHPVFGNREVWVPQDAHPYFYPTIRRHADDFRDACRQAVDDALESVG
jgi:hypothetical protein